MVSEFDMSAFRNGRLKEFNSVFKAFYISLCRFAYRFVLLDNESKDIVQEAFISLWNERLSIENETHIRAFLYRAVRNSCVDYFRHERIKNVYAEGFKANYTELQVEHMVLEEEIERIMEKTENSLAPKCRKIFILAMEGKDNNEIAELLGISVNTVKTQKRIAYKILKDEVARLYSLMSFFSI